MIDLTKYKKLFFVLLVTAYYFGNAVAQFNNYRWTTIETNTLPTGRHENAFFEYKGKFYLLGGRGINPVNVFDPENNTWEAKGKSPIEIHHFQPVVYGNAVYLMGAMTNNYPNEPPLENIWIYYPETDKWEKGPEIPENRRRGGAGAVLYKDKIYVICGIKFGHTSGTTNYFDSFDPKTGKWEILTDAPHIRDHFPAVVVDDKLYCVGGRNSSVHHPDNFTAYFTSTIPQIDVYDFTDNKWYTMKGSLPVPTAAGGMINIGNYLIYMGGEASQHQAYNQTQCLDITSGQWTQLAPLNMGRHGTSAIFYNDKIYIAAGSENKGGGDLKSIEVFSQEHGWKSLFNGVDLSGWQVMSTEQDKDKLFWTAEDGAIVSNSLHSDGHNYVWLQTIGEYDDFELRLKFQVSRLNKGNSGVQIRSRYDKDAEIEPGEKGWLDGPQIDIEAQYPWRNGLIYDETRNTKRWINPNLPDWQISPEDVNHRVRFYYEDEESGWNDMTIICKDFHIKTIVNNVVVSDYNGESVLNDETHRELNVGRKGHIALQLHKNSSSLIRFKDIEIKTLTQK